MPFDATDPALRQVLHRSRGREMKLQCYPTQRASRLEPGQMRTVHVSDREAFSSGLGTAAHRVKRHLLGPVCGLSLW